MKKLKKKVMRKEVIVEESIEDKMHLKDLVEQLKIQIMNAFATQIQA
jgi:hypothetical protein